MIPHVIPEDIRGSGAFEAMSTMTGTTPVDGPSSKQMVLRRASAAREPCMVTIANIVIQPVGDPVLRPTVRFLADWVTGNEASAREHLDDHPSGRGSSLVAMLGDCAVGIVTIRWHSNYVRFKAAGIPLVHQISVAGPFLRHGIATTLMDAAENLARDRGVARLGITVGLFDAYGPAQRMYAKRGYIPDGRGACLGTQPICEGDTVTVGHDLIMWLIKDLL